MVYDWCEEKEKNILYILCNPAWGTDGKFTCHVFPVPQASTSLPYL